MELLNLLARDLARKFEVYVFPAWGDETRVFAQDEGPTRYVGMSLVAWRKMVLDNLAATGYDLMHGAKNIRVTMLAPQAVDCEVHIEERLSMLAGEEDPSLSPAIKTIRIERPRGRVPKSAPPAEPYLFRR